MDGGAVAAMGYVGSADAAGAGRADWRGCCYALARCNRWALLGVIAVPRAELVWRQHGWDAGAGAGAAAAAVWVLCRPHGGLFGAVALMGGLAFSGLVHWQVAMAMLVAFLLLSSESYLATYTLSRV